MKNLKISARLIVSFLLITAFSVMLAGVGIFASIFINTRYTYLLEGPVEQETYLKDMQLQFTMMRYRTANYAMEVNNPDIITGTLTPQYQTAYDTFTTNLRMYEEKNNADTVQDQAVIRQNLDNAKKLKELVDKFKAESENTRSIALTGDYDTATTSLRNAIPLATEINTLFTDMITPCSEYVHGESAAMDGTAVTITIVQVVLTVVCLIISLILAFYVSGLISKPLTVIATYLNQASTTGDMTLSPDEAKNMDDLKKGKDEISILSESMLAFVSRINDVSNVLESVADNDLTMELVPLSDRDTMGLSLKRMTENLNRMFNEITVSTSQVSTGSKQIADGAQALAQGSTQQAAAVEQLSSSIATIADKTKENADMATRAAHLANSIKQSAEKGSNQMDHMMDAVKEINQASQSINKVIKVIDDIAFQTNILALNAAVEAARAGQHGKGFAVVAEEVRSLAAKSAEAAKDTGSLIANSMEKAELGARIADETAASLVEIVSGINESNQIVNQIAMSSEEQSAGITQINKGIEQVSQVVQQNSATAEQSAASSEQMSGQSDMLEQLVAQFKLKGGTSNWQLPGASGSSQKRLTMPGDKY